VDKAYFSDILKRILLSFRGDMSTARKIPVIKAVLMSINVMVGGGILFGPAPMAAIAGSWSFLGWLVVAFIYLPIVLSITRMAEVFPTDGGLASYCKQGLGDFLGFCGGWIYFLGYAASAATLLSVYRAYLQLKWPGFFLFQNPYLFFAFAVAVLVYLNNLRVTVMADLQSYLTVIKLLPVLLAVILLPFFASGTLSFSLGELQMLPWSLTYAIFGFLGFEFCASLTDTIEGGAPQARKAILGGFLAVSAIYIIFHYSLLNIMGVQGLVANTAAGYPLFVAKKFAFLGSFLIPLISLTTVITYFNSSNGLMTLDGFVLSGIAKGKQIRFAETLDQRNRNDRPYVAVAVAAMFIYALGVFVPSTHILAAVTNFGVTLTFLLANLSLWLADNRATAVNKFINLLAMLFLILLLIYHFSVVGDTMALRLQNLSLLFLAAIAGLLLYRPRVEA
jgi:amino acid transporter